MVAAYRIVCHHYNRVYKRHRFYRETHRQTQSKGL
jgi:hypothetical protein